MLFGIAVLVGSTVAFIFRKRIAQSVERFHRHEFGGGGEYYASQATSTFMGINALIGVLLGAYLILRALEIV